MKRNTIKRLGMFSVLIFLFVISLFIGLGEGSSRTKKITMLLCWPKDQNLSKILTDLTEEYIKINKNFSYEFEYVPQSDVVQKVQVLLASDSLPDIFAYGSSRLHTLKKENSEYAIVNLESELKKLGVLHWIDPKVISMLKELNVDKGMYALPGGLNIEGFFYNKELFERAGIKKTPKTWDELLEICEKLKKAGIQPIALGGKDRWPITRLIHAYIYRSLGPDAMYKAIKGIDGVKFTDPVFVKAAKVIYDMAKNGYFGEGANTISNGTAEDMVLNKKAAMIYDGSWLLSKLNNPSQNPSGENIGFFSVPLVDPKVSPITIYPMNPGVVVALSSKKYDSETAKWLRYIVPKIGNKMMEVWGVYAGYRVTKEVELPYYSKLIYDEVKKAKGYTFWFETFFDLQTNAICGQWAQSLMNGTMTPEEFMLNIQKSIEANR